MRVHEGPTATQSEEILVEPAPLGQVPIAQASAQASATEEGNGDDIMDIDEDDAGEREEIAAERDRKGKGRAKEVQPEVIEILSSDEEIDRARAEKPEVTMVESDGGEDREDSEQGWCAQPQDHEEMAQEGETGERAESAESGRSGMAGSGGIGGTGEC